MEGDWAAERTVPLGRWNFQGFPVEQSRNGLGLRRRSNSCATGSLGGLAHNLRLLERSGQIYAAVKVSGPLIHRIGLQVV